VKSSQRSHVRKRIIITPENAAHFYDVCPHILVFGEPKRGWGYVMAEPRKRLCESLGSYKTRKAAKEAASTGHRCGSIS
jgi:hypothetical protein